METKDQVFGAMEKTLDKKDALNTTITSLWRPILNHENESLDQADSRVGKSRFATSQYAIVAYIMKEENEWIGSYRCFLEPYICQLCSLI